MWSSVGSVGTVSNADAGKVAFAGAVAQLGVGIDGANTEAVTAPVGGGVGVPPLSATIRYPVHEADLGNQAPGLWNLTVRYRDGSGNVTVRLMQVAVETGVETAVVILQSGVGFNRSDSFHNEISQGTFGVDFERNVYYVAAVLTGSSFAVGVAPAIQLIQIGPA